MRITLLALACCISASALAAPIATEHYTSESVVYRCAGGTRLAVAYLNLKSGESLATLYLRGRQYVLRSAPSGSGMRYVSLDEQAGYRWYTNADEGTLAHLPADHTAKEHVLRKNCRVIRDIK
jgi:membrane-bound inhibitor of C-type lysozyme